MSSVLCITIRFLDPEPAFHGKRDGDKPEWPPSPLRLFQALLDSAANRWRNAQFEAYAKPALEWFETCPRPVIVTPVHTIGRPYRVSVPNNDLNSPAAFWVRGQEPVKPHRPIDLRTMKTVCPVRLRGKADDANAVHYLYPLSDGGCPHLEVLSAAARSITHLGWGVDMVAGNAAVITDEEAGKLPGERWQPAEDASAGGLRVPREGTLANLAEKHTAFLNRLSGDGFKPVPPLSAFAVVGYRRATEPAGRAWVAFELLKPEATGKASFDTARRCRDVAAWVRNLTGCACAGWPFGDTAAFVHGHDPADNAKQLTGDSADDRFMYLPLPTINPKLNRVESIRRVLIAAPARFRDRVEWVRRRLPGQDLTDEQKRVVGVLNLLPKSDWVFRQYTGESAVWSTVTPVIRPGHDDRDADKAERLVRTAFVQAGLPEPADVEWRGVGFRAGVDLAGRYRVPTQLGRWPRLHVRVRFPAPIRGPLAVGAGRYRGFGVFAAEMGS